ncbi:MAG: hypothetical protein KIS68_14925 [Bauldia sp.]|nr:hypothetical protein [Bauldia sp.]
MNRITVAMAAFAATLAAGPAFAIDVTVGGGEDVDAIVGKPMNVNRNIDDTMNQNRGVTTPPAVINPMAPDVGAMMVAADTGTPPFAVIEAADAVGMAVVTNDGTPVGTVASVETTTDGITVLVVDLDPAIGDADRIAVRLDAVVMTEAGFAIQTDAADLEASLMAALAPPVATP